MQLTILGSGSSLIEADRASIGFLLQIKKDFILIDSGYGVNSRLKQAGVDTLNLTHILITHTHPDHVADLPAMLWARHWSVPGTIYITGPVGFKKFFNKLKNLTMPSVLEKMTKYKVFTQEISNGKINYKNWHLESFVLSTKQRFTYLKNSNAYKIINNHKTIAYTADNNYYDFNEKLINFIKGVDLLILECTLPEPEKTYEHLWPEACGIIAQKAQAKKLVLVHFSENKNNWRKNIKKIVGQYYSGPITIAQDLMKIKI